MNYRLLIFRLLRREWRSGTLRVLAAALVIAVASVSAVGFFTDRIQRAMEDQAAELLAADRVVESSSPLRDSWYQKAHQLGLQTAQTQTFRSVISTDAQLQLAELKAVDDHYPLKGELKAAAHAGADEQVEPRGPQPGNVWLDTRLATLLDVTVGDDVMLGRSSLRFSKVLTFEPDRGGQLFSIAPRMMMNLADLPETGLVGKGSRIHYHLLLAGDDDALTAYQQWLMDGHLGKGDEFEGDSESRPQMAAALERAERFLGLASLISVLLAGVAAATAAHRYASRHFDSSAIMRCLGASQATVTIIYIGQLLLLGVAAIVVGIIVGFLAQFILAQILAELFTTQLPTPGWLPAVSGFATGMITLCGFALPPLLALRNVPPLRVLRNDLLPAGFGSSLAYIAAISAFLLLMLWQARDVTLTLYVFGGSVATLLVLGLAATAMVKLLGLLEGGADSGWRFGIANIARRAKGSRVQVVAFGLGIMVLLLLSLVRSDLLAGWRDSLPADAPNHFLINIQPHEQEAVEAFLEQETGRGIELYPMIRGRLTAINDKPVNPTDYEHPRAQRLAEREFNLSSLGSLQEDNRIVAGQWWGETVTDIHQWSVETGIAETLGIELGDTLTYQVAGETVSGKVTSLRTVDWDSFQVNFFVVAPPGLLQDKPASYISAFYLSPEQRLLTTTLIRTFPSITVIDVDALLSRVRAIIERVTLAVEFIFVFTLLAGVVVLMAAVEATRDDRLRETAVLRTLGASRPYLRNALIAEFSVMGALAGLLAALSASLLGYMLAEYIFHFSYGANPWVIVAGLLAGSIGVGSIGWMGTRRVLQRPPLTTLRQLN